VLQRSLNVVQGLLAQAPAPTPTPTGGAADVTPIINTTGIVTAGLQLVVPILLLVTGIWILGRARAGRTSEVTTASGISLLGICVIVSAPVLFLLAPKLVALATGIN
jgi:hypothetical protein